MIEATNDQEEFALQAMFGRAIPPIPDQGFSATVLRRVRRNIWNRRLVLLPTIAIGLLITLPALAQFLLALSNELLGLVARAEESEVLGQFQVLLSMLPLRETAQAASEEIARVNEQIDTVSWYRQNQIFILAGLMALVSLVATRILAR